MTDEVYTTELMEAAMRGEEAALRFLYESTQDRLTQTVHSMIRDEDTVQDVVQDSFIKGFRNLRQLDKPESFLAWMRRIAVNTARDYMRKNKPVLFSDLVNENGEELEFQDEHIGHLPDALLDQQDTSRLIQEIVSGLSEDQQLAIGMYYFEDMSVREIADLLGCTENTVKSRLNYGRKNIEKKVRELEKTGVKLYSLAPLPFLIWLLRNLHTNPSKEVLQTVLTIGGNASAGVAVSAGATAASEGVIMEASTKLVGKAAKNLAIKIAAGVLAVAVASGGAAMVYNATRNARPKQNDAPVLATEVTESPTEMLHLTSPAVQPSAVPTTQPPIDPTNAYQLILDEYIAACADPTNYNYYADAPERYPHINNAGMDYYHSMGAVDLYYAKYDIDGNGVDELLIGTPGDVWDAYAFDGEKAIKLVDVPALGGGRACLTIMNTGEMYVAGSSGADSSSYYMLRIRNDGFSTEQVFYFFFNYNEYGSYYQGLDGNQELTLSEEAFEEKINRYQEADINWEMLVEAPITWSEAYQVIIDEYGFMVNAMKDYIYVPNKDPHAKEINQENLNHIYRGYKSGSGFYLSYSYYDIDKNGTKELLIGYASDYYLNSSYPHILILDVYTFDGTQAVQLFPQRSLGDTAILSIINDSELFFHDSCQEGENCTIARIASDGYSLEVLNSFQIRIENNEIIYYNDTESLSEWEFFGKYQPVESAYDIEWTSFAFFLN